MRCRRSHLRGARIRLSAMTWASMCVTMPDQCMALSNRGFAGLDLNLGSSISSSRRRRQDWDAQIPTIVTARPETRNSSKVIYTIKVIDMLPDAAADDGLASVMNSGLRATGPEPLRQPACRCGSATNRTSGESTCLRCRPRRRAACDGTACRRCEPKGRRCPVFDGVHRRSLHRMQALQLPSTRARVAAGNRYEVG